MDTISGETRISPGYQVRLDGRRFVHCTYAQCELIYEGGELPEFDGCAFDKCTVRLSGDAAKIERVKALLKPFGFQF